MHIHPHIVGMDATLPHEERTAPVNQGVVIRDAASQALNPPFVPAVTTSVPEVVTRAHADQLSLLTEHINDLEKSWEEEKTRAYEAEQRNKVLQQALELARINDAKVTTILDNPCTKNRALRAEVRKLNSQGKDPVETSRRAHR